MGKVIGQARKDDTLGLRVTSRARFGLVLIARAQNSSLGAAANWCFAQIFAPKDAADNANGWRLLRGVLPRNLLDLVWSPHEHERFALLGEHYPKLLLDNEMYLWQTLQGMPEYWKQVPVGAAKGNKARGQFVRKLDLKKLEANWDKLKKRACL